MAVACQRARRSGRLSLRKEAFWLNMQLSPQSCRQELVPGFSSSASFPQRMYAEMRKQRYRLSGGVRPHLINLENLSWRSARRLRVSAPRDPWIMRTSKDCRDQGNALHGRADMITMRAQRVWTRTEHRDAPSSASTKPSPKSAPDSSNRFCSHPEGTGNGAALSSIRKLPLPQHRSLLLPRCCAHEVHQLLGKRVTPEAWAKNCPVLCYKCQSRVKSAGVTLKISENRTDILRNAA